MAKFELIQGGSANVSDASVYDAIERKPVWPATPELFYNQSDKLTEEHERNAVRLMTGIKPNEPYAYHLEGEA